MIFGMFVTLIRRKKMVKEKIKLNKIKEIPEGSKLIGNIYENKSNYIFSFFIGQDQASPNLASGEVSNPN